MTDVISDSEWNHNLEFDLITKYTGLQFPTCDTLEMEME
jgi:hypothetical protein